MKKTKIALIGPGYGHNIYPHLEYFNNSSDVEVDFYFHTKDEFSVALKNVNFRKFTSSIFYLLFNIRKYDIIWLMGGGRLLYLVSPILFFKKKKSASILNIWSEKLPRQAVENSFKGFITSFFVNRFDIITCHWYGVADMLKSKFGEKVQVNVIGITADYFKIPEEIDPDMLRLMAAISESTYNFYFPKSITESSRHDLIVEAVKILNKDQSLPAFKVYFLEGNVVDNVLKEQVLTLISEYKLEEQVVLLPKTKFFKTEDFNCLWQKMDCGFQIAQYDQLSNTIFEPLINKKELIITDIPPYCYLADYFGFDFNLIPLDAQAIAEAMRLKISGIGIKSEQEKEQIVTIIREKYLYETNFKSILKKFEKGN